MLTKVKLGGGTASSTSSSEIYSCRDLKSNVHHNSQSAKAVLFAVVRD